MLEALAASAPEQWLDNPRSRRDNCLEKLAPQARRIVDLFYQNEHKPKAIALMMNWTPLAVSVALSAPGSSYASASNDNWRGKPYERRTSGSVD